MAHNLIAAIQFVTCMYVVWRGLMVLNHMNKNTAHDMRIAYVLLTGGGGFGAMTFNRGDLLVALLSAGLALFLHGDRRNESEP